jgi:hypothetical protein
VLWTFDSALLGTEFEILGLVFETKLLEDDGDFLRGESMSTVIS